MLALLNEPVKVKLLGYFDNPFDLSLAAAKTCYSPRVIEALEITEKQRDVIGALTYDSGHHTVYQHVHFVFGLENISRQFVWSVLHSHPFYNSEQSSQRYVRLDEARAFIPPLKKEALEVYEQSVQTAWSYYKKISEIIQKDTFNILSKIRHFNENTDDSRREKIEKEAEKKAIELARYVIPIGAYTSMIHTISGITLHRLYRLMNSSDVPYENTLVIKEMVNRVNEVDPNFFGKVGDPPLEPYQVPECRLPHLQPVSENYIKEFDNDLGGLTSKLFDYSPNGEEVVAEALRSVFGVTKDKLTTDEALDLILNPAKNAYRLDKLNLSFHSPIMRSLFHTSYTFKKRISHTADSQDQRHRMVPASRPLMNFTISRKPDYITPMLIKQNNEANECYVEAMGKAWEGYNSLLSIDVPHEFALYLLPNSVSLRFLESGQFLYLLHKWTMRTCLNAQEEIYEASMQELAQVKKVHPRLARYIGPNCTLRAKNVTPYCTEGAHFCGVPVWKLFPDISRKL